MLTSKDFLSLTKETLKNTKIFRDTVGDEEDYINLTLSIHLDGCSEFITMYFDVDVDKYILSTLDKSNNFVPANFKACYDLEDAFDYIKDWYKENNK